VENTVERISMEEFEERVRDGEIPPDMEIRIEVVTGEDFVPAGNLELYEALADPGMRAFRASLVQAGVPLVTIVLIGVQVRLYLLSKVPKGASFLLDNAPNWAPAILEQGQVHRLLSYGLLQVELSHLLFNLLFLAWAGWNLERGLGRRNLACIFLVSIYCGGLASMLMTPGRPSLGSSGGDFGLLAAAVVFGWKHEALIPPRSRRLFGWAVLPYVVVSLGLGINAPSVDNWGHLGGLVGGWFMGSVLEPEAWTRHAQGNARWRRRGAVLMVLSLAWVSWRGPALIGLREESERGATSQRPRSWNEEWTFTGDRGWASRTRRATWVRHTGIHDHPLRVKDAERVLLELIDAGGSEPKVLFRESQAVDGRSATRMRIGFVMGDEDQVMEALLVMRGPTLYRFHLTTPARWAKRYRRLADRLFSAVHLEEPPSLLKARIAATSTPRNWRALEALGREAATAGEPAEAAKAYETAWVVAGAHQEEVATAWLDLYRDYGVGMEVEQIALLAQRHDHDVGVLMVAIDAYERAGQPEEALSLLEDISQRFPTHFSVRRARASRGLP